MNGKIFLLPKLPNLWQCTCTQGSTFSRNILFFAGNVKQLIPCVSVVVFGLFSHDDRVKAEHYFLSHQESRVNFLEGDNKEMLSFIIRHFSQPGSMILDLTGLEGRQMISNLFCLFLDLTLSCNVLFLNNSMITCGLHIRPG